MGDLHAALLAAIEERERIAREASADSGDWHCVKTVRHVAISSAIVTDVNQHDIGHVVSSLDAQHIAANDPATVLRGCAEDRDILRRHKPIQELATVINGASEYMTLCAYEWGDGDGHLLRWSDCPDVLSVARRHGIEA